MSSQRLLIVDHPWAVVQRVLGVLLIFFSATMLLPVLIGLIYRDGAVAAFGTSFLIAFSTGVALWFPVRRVSRDMKIRDGFLIVSLFWTVLGLVGALPLLLADRPGLSFTDAAFEAVSGLTTTGATVIVGLDTLPHAILFWREWLHWIGGMGIIVLAVAILPMLGTGGMQLVKAETPGPIKDDKLAPRIKKTASALWWTYTTITMACAGTYWLLGMSPFDAITHAFGTLATGGFSNYDASMAYFHSNAILIAATAFMFVSGASFSLHFICWRNGSFMPYLRNIELRTYTLIIVGASTLVAVTLYAHGTYASIKDAVIQGTFQVVSLMTDTGFGSANFSQWPSFIPILLMLLACLGGCAGSTSGGIKIVRLVLLLKQAWRELKSLVHPNAAFSVKLENRVLSESILRGVWAFFFLYVAGFAVMVLILMALGLDGLTAFSAVAACINNMGPALGVAAANFSPLPSPAKWFLIVAMIGGRLEIFTLLIIFTPEFWRR
ncbi:TrkH family potassium uptake protein [Salinisphaera sp. RV14]|uniref:TrkH family potassium uptake protein n=1 Tax=Salinisphaera sp. RV14 TaxID=3454140 RepID=UPI003F87257E